MRIDNITVGADPELFIINEKTGKVVSSIGIIPGEKGNPYVAADMPKGFGLETDNILAEFNIPPVKNMMGFVNNIQYMQEYITKFVKNINPDYNILCAASKVVDADQLTSKQAKEFGCDVDFNVYTQEPNPKPKGNRTRTRSAGLHLHIGYNDPNIDTSLLIIKYMDAYIGVPSILKDNDKKRRSLYGKAGCFRLCPYGAEYRVLSSAMMKDTDTLVFVWEQFKKALNAAINEKNLPPEELVISAINNSDKDLASKLINEYNLI